MRITIATSSQCARSAARLRGATLSTKVSSAANPSQMTQLPTAATSRIAGDGCDSSISTTGMTSSASATIAHSSECVTRPLGNWRQCIPALFDRPAP